MCVFKIKNKNKNHLFLNNTKQKNTIYQITNEYEFKLLSKESRGNPGD